MIANKNWTVIDSPILRLMGMRQKEPYFVELPVKENTDYGHAAHQRNQAPRAPSQAGERGAITTTLRADLGIFINLRLTIRALNNSHALVLRQ